MRTSPLIMGGRRAATWAGAVLAVVAVSGCFPCEGVLVAFPDNPLVVGGVWNGEATSSQRPTLELRLELDVDYVSARSYDVTGTVVIDGARLLDVLGAGYGFCEQRFEPVASVVRAAPAPEAPRFEATLYDADGTRAGSVLAYRVIRTDGDYDTMEGELLLDEEGEERRYGFVVERQ
jgi:hypothetical protein